jgi:hypothetical protein
MKILKKILLSLLLLMVLTTIGGYFYFNKKFTPQKNYLIVENETSFVPITWLNDKKDGLLLPIHFEGDSAIYYMQFDTGSPYTVFYASNIKDIKPIIVFNKVAKASFYIGKTKISSDKFKIYNSNNSDQNDTINIIGTLGADILENRKTIINFKENYIALNLAKLPISFQNKLIDFSFKKRKIIIKGFLNGNAESFLYDSGSSAYELLTNKEVWNDLKLDSSKIIIEKSQSWNNVLTTYTANCNQNIKFNTQDVLLHNVTYVEGYSKIQYWLMKFSGMTGMLGNKIFLNNSLYFDCVQNKMGID